MTTASDPDRRFYGRRHGRRLRPGRRRLMAELLPRLQIVLPEADQRITPATLFATRVADVWLEIGFGGGEHLAAQARAHPEIGLIGCEPYINGVAALLAGIEADDIANIRILPGDARDLLDALPDASIGRAFILFPDPWPKARHARRRLVAPETLDTLARILKDGAELRMATDDPGYLRWMLEHAIRCAGLHWTATAPGDWRARPADWPATRYEEKAASQGRKSTYLRFVRTARHG
jgi:tRNA (guanine-N7-)-methyltransferase